MLRLVETDADPVPAGAEVDRLVASDGVAIRVARWLPEGATRGTIVILNGRTEFIEKYFETVGDLLRRRYAVATLDWRGQGLSDRVLANPHKGHVESFDRYVADFQRVLEHFVAPACPRPWSLLAHSLGGCIGLHHLSAHPGGFGSAVFTAPLWGIGRSVGTPALLRTLVNALHRIGLGRRYVPGRGDYGRTERVFERNPLTSDPARFARFVAQVEVEPRLALGGPTVHWVREVFAAIAAIHEPGFVERIDTPIRVCTAPADTVVSVPAQAAVVRRLPNARQQLFAGARHELLVERDDIRHRCLALLDTL